MAVVLPALFNCFLFFENDAFLVCNYKTINPTPAYWNVYLGIIATIIILIFIVSFKIAIIKEVDI